jgi:uncharacterized repeat protein (TIGR03806 family)
VLLRIPQPYSNHNGGTVIFGPDGYFYIGLGDGGAGNDPHGNGQNLGTLLGKILRIDVDHEDPGLAYAIPKDNPFVGRGGKARGEIWAYGIRNIWRMAFDRLTGTLWAGDVGQDLWEEVDVIVRGGNYGWNLREGTHSFGKNGVPPRADLIEPVIDYHHSVGKSITGGVVYRGKKLPELYGAYLYSDFVSGDVWALRWDGVKATANLKIAATKLPVSAFGEDRDGEVYFTSFDGSIYKFQHAATAAAAPGSPVVGATAAFPRRLSETGLLLSTKALTPSPSLVPYAVNVPLWSDGALKDRFFTLPAKASVEFSEKDAWSFPQGTVFVKTFYLPTAVEGEKGRRLETRLLVSSPRGWDGYTYLWDDDQRDARLLDAAMTRTYDVPALAADGSRTTKKLDWYFPSRADCMACHTKAAGFVLGPNTRQMNRPRADDGSGENQLESFARAGVFSKPLPARPEALDAYPRWGTKSPAPAAALARAYLDSNCAMCHAPGGTGNAKADLRYHTPLESAFLVNQEPGQGRLGPEDSKVIRPGDPARSELILRVGTRAQGKMPPLASGVVDEEAVRVLSEWVKGLPGR